MKRDIDIKEIVKNLSHIGVNATITKSRLELLKVLTTPVQNKAATNA